MGNANQEPAHGRPRRTNKSSGTHCDERAVTDPNKAVFLSYASQDAEAAQNLCNALRAAGIEVWFDQSELRGGDAWDQKIRQQIRDCALFVPIISAHTQARPEGYFRLEWKLAVDRSHLMASEKAFLVPVVVDATTEPEALVPMQFRDVQWTRIRAGEVLAVFVDHIAALLNQPVASHVGIPERGVSRTPARRLPIVLIALSVAAVVALAIATAMRGGWLSQRPAPKVEASAASAPVTNVPAATPEKSVAVLPFADMSEKKDQEYFSDGLSEELINHLAHAPDLKVIARTSSFQFKGKNEDMRTIGQKLGVANLLEGSVRTSGKTLRVTAQLIKVSDGSHLWSESYDRGMGDIFKVQDEIASAVVAALQATMTKPKSSPDARRENIEAYNAILRGRYFARKRTKQDSERAVASFEEAIRLDPNDAVAWMELADAYNIRLANSWMRPRENYALARSAIDRALAIDPNLADAHFVLGNLEWTYNFDFAAAQAQFSRARELDPNLGPLNSEAFVALVNGQSDQAVRILERIVERNPLSTYQLEWLAEFYFASDRLPEAERTLRDLLALDPSFAGAHCDLGEVLLARNQPDAALAVMSEEPDEGNRLTCLPDAMWKLGRRKEADALLVEAASKYSDSGAYGFAASYAMRNDKDQAFKWLNRAYENREPEVFVMSKWDPLLRNLHRDPRFTALLRKLKLPE
jgi:TolB-like protein/Flp pilus assembly protein TadD